MQNYSNSNPLIKRIKTVFGKTHQKHKRQKQQLPQRNQKIVSFNGSLDVKNHMFYQKMFEKRNKSNHTINIDQQDTRILKRNNAFFDNIKKQVSKSSTGIVKVVSRSSTGNVKVVYGSIQSPMKPSLSNFHSQKQMKHKKARLSLCSVSGSTPSHSLLTPIHPSNIPRIPQTMNISSHMIQQKYMKIKQLLKMEKYSQAVIFIKQIINYVVDLDRKKQMYFWLVASMIRDQKQDNLLIENYILDCLQQFTHYYQIYLYWAKLKARMTTHLDNVVQIYQKAINIQPTNSQAYLQLSDIYLAGSKYKQAYEVLEIGFQKAVKSTSIPIKIIQNHRNFNLSLSSIQDYVIRIQDICGKKTSEYLYILGFLQLKKHHLNQSLIYFLESIKYNSSLQSSTKSLQHLINIHIQKRDFYSAYYDLKRSRHLNINFNQLDKYQHFLEGVNFVMKKQYQKGINLLQNIIQDKRHISQYTKQPHSEQQKQQHYQYNKQHNTKKQSIKQLVQNNQQQKTQFSRDIMALTVKYLGYAYFKLANHQMTVKCFRIIQNDNQAFDKISQYNLLLAEGIILADKQNKFDKAVQKFHLAKNVLRKVQPWVYQSLITIQKVVFNQNNSNQNHNVRLNSRTEQQRQGEVKKAVQQALLLMQRGYDINSCSSNLLFHLSILQLYQGCVPQSLVSINRCIQKAQQNLPKYFYLRGLCYACQHQILKAINEFSIAISLNKQHALSYLERSKCYFITGDTEVGFRDLKMYMTMQPKDVRVHHMIGDLLYQGTSYSDSVKAYDQMAQQITIQALCMKFKAQLRVAYLKQMHNTMQQITAHKQFSQQKFTYDMAAFALMTSLLTGPSKKSSSIQKNLKKLNQLLQSPTAQKGKLFHIVDCMNLVGIASFYLCQFNQAYQYFILVLQFYKQTKSENYQETSSTKNQIFRKRKQTEDLKKSNKNFVQTDKLNVQFQQGSYDLWEEDIYYNIFLCLIALDQRQSIRQIINSQLLLYLTNKNQIKIVKKMRSLLNIQKQPLENGLSAYRQGRKEQLPASKIPSGKIRKQQQCLVLQPRITSRTSQLLKMCEFTMNFSQGNAISVKTQLIWTPYHSSSEVLSFMKTAKQLVYQLHAGYADDMPEGPWIRRNQFGVLFTDQVIDQTNETSFVLTTNRNHQQDHSELENTSPKNTTKRYDHNYQLYEDDFNDPLKSENRLNDKKKAFLKQLKLDLKIENKLNKIIKRQT